MRFGAEVHREKLRGWLAQLVSFQTFREDGVNDDAAFCSAVQDGFGWLEEWANYRQLDCVNWRDRVLEIRAGNGPEVAVATHLDVVPYSYSDWSHDDPGKFHLENNNGPVYYGRGVIDNKGPLAAILLLLDQLRTESDIPVSLRLIVDSAEEVGFDNLRAYFDQSSQSPPSRTLVADGFYPLVAGEKGLLQVTVDISWNRDLESPSLELSKLESGEAFNQVAAGARAELTGSEVNLSRVRDFLEAEGEALEVSVSTEQIETNTILLRTKGSKAHAAAPDEGLNAASGLIRLLGSGLPFSFEQDTLFQALAASLTEADGTLLTDASSFGLDAVDKRFDRGTTVNLGKMTLSQGESLRLSLDFRLVPSTKPAGALEQLNDWRPDPSLAQTTVEVSLSSLEPPLLADLNEALPAAALEAYESVREGDASPFFMGGRTHAAVLDNAFAFGCMEPGKFESYGFHGPDESVPEQELLETAEIYAETLQNFRELV